MILHTINKPPALLKCQELIQSGDTVVLLENGVNLALGELPAKDVTWLAIEADVRARGLGDRLPPTVGCVDYAGLVELSATAEQICNWF